MAKQIRRSFIMLRKINGWLALFTTVLVLNHAGFHAVWMLSECSIEKPLNGVSLILFAVMMLHAIISIILAILGHSGAEKRKCKAYPDLNIPTNIQRVSGVLLIFLTVLHVGGTIGILHPPQIVHAVLPPVFFAIVMMHTAISTSKAFITLGIGNAKFIKVADIVIKLICAFILIADVIGFYIYIF